MNSAPNRKEIRFGLVVIAIIVMSASMPDALAEKLRVVILTDIGEGDPDDEQSLVRVLSYANEFDIEGLVATVNKDHHSVQPEVIRRQIRAYGDVLDNFQKHAFGWPSEKYLLDRVASSAEGIRLDDVVGEGRSTSGSNLIIDVVDADDPRPVWICSWDGLVALAQAFYDVSKTRSRDEARAFLSKIRVFTITEDSDVEPWLRRRAREEYGVDIFYVWADRNKTFSGISRGGNESLITDRWNRSNVGESHGPLGALYPNRGPGPQYLTEGDTAATLFLMSFVGLGSPDHPEWGGWGGRYIRQVKDGSRVFSDADPGDAHNGGIDTLRSLWRWRPAFQNDFAARMDWQVRDRNDANHPPVAAFNGQAGTMPVTIQTSPGNHVDLSANGSSDPDSDGLSYKWYTYNEAGTYGRNVSIPQPTAQETYITVPNDTRGRTIHIILEVTDSGSPPLTRYRRVILDVR